MSDESRPHPDGDPAFPRPASKKYFDGPNETNCTHSDGRTLRDYFAGQALVGILAARFRYPDDKEVVAKLAYGVADAMLAERAKPLKAP